MLKLIFFGMGELGERMCKADFDRRGMLFNYLVKSIMAYGVELWRWGERGEFGESHA